MIIIAIMKLNSYEITRRPSKPAGLTLIEVLTMLAIIGIIGAIAIPQLTSWLTSDAQDLRNRRNAQELAGVFATAQVAGRDFAASGDLVQTIRNVITGGSPSDGPFKGQFYGMRSLKEQDIAGVQKYLSLKGDMLCYNSRGAP
jgi:type II secretory pathway pseudopilin PulG